MKRKQPNQNTLECKKPKNQFSIGLHEIFTNQGFEVITHEIIKKLGTECLKACRLVSKSWKNTIDNSKIWMTLQLEKILWSHKVFRREGKNSNRRYRIKSKIGEEFPQWEVIIGRFMTAKTFAKSPGLSKSVLVCVTLCISVVPKTFHYSSR